MISPTRADANWDSELDDSIPIYLMKLSRLPLVTKGSVPCLPGIKDDESIRDMTKNGFDDLARGRAESENLIDLQLVSEKTKVLYS